MALKVPIPQFTETRAIQITRRDFFYLSNILSIFRLFTVPFIFYFIYCAQWIVAIACGAVAVITDLLDGFFARRLKQHTELGYILDPVADKLALFRRNLRARDIPFQVPSMGIFGDCYPRYLNCSRQCPLDT